MGSLGKETKDTLTKDYAISLDKADPLRSLRDEFVFPTKQSLKLKRLPRPGR